MMRLKPYSELGEKDVEEVKKQAEADDDGRSYMRASDWQVVESIRDRRRFNGITAQCFPDHRLANL